MTVTLRSTSFTGECPAGVHWTPGETRVVSDLPETLPAGLEVVAHPPAKDDGGEE